MGGTPGTSQDGQQTCVSKNKDNEELDEEMGDENDENKSKKQRNRILKLTDEQMETVAQYLQANELLIDKTHEDYKNVQKRDEIEGRISEAINVSLADYKLWYKSMRTTYGRA